MKEINILQDYGVYELGSESEIKPIIEKIDINNQTHIKLDLTGCLPDYPVTSQIIDKIISQMKKLPGKKSLDIVVEYSLPHEILINWLFLGSKDLNIQDDKSMPLKDIWNAIYDGIEESSIVIKIHIYDNKRENVIDEIIFDKRI